MVNGGAHPERLETCSQQHGDGALNVARLLHEQERLHERLKRWRVLEANGNNAGPETVGRFDALDHRVGGTGGNEISRLGVFLRLNLPPGVMEGGKESLGVVYLDF